MLYGQLIKGMQRLFGIAAGPFLGAVVLGFINREARSIVSDWRTV